MRRFLIPTLALASILLAAACDGTDPAVDSGCSARTGGAEITFRIAEEEDFTAWITDGPFITEAKDLLATGTRRVPVFGQVVRDSGCDEDWNFHVDPANVHFADVTIEICDGRPSYIEANLDEWISTVKSWCPWSGRVVSIDEH